MKKGREMEEGDEDRIQLDMSCILVCTPQRLSCKSSEHGSGAATSYLKPPGRSLGQLTLAFLVAPDNERDEN